MGAIFLYIPLFVVFYVLTQHFLHKIRNLPPTPFPSLPFIGHLHLLNKPIYRALANISNRTGPVTFLRLGSRPVLIVSSPSAAEECLTKNDVVFANRPRLLISKCFGYNNTNLVWSSYGDNWRNLRRISTVEMLSTHRLQLLSTVRLEEVKSLIHKLVESEKSQTPVNMKHAFFDLTFNLMLRMLVGKRFYGDDVEDAEEARLFRELQTESTRLSGKSNVGDFVPLIGWLGFGSKLGKEMKDCQNRKDIFMQKLIEEQRKTKMEDSLRDGRKKTMMEVLLELQQSEPQRYSDQTIRALMLVTLSLSL